jgi:hypothetical protein
MMTSPVASYKIRRIYLKASLSQAVDNVKLLYGVNNTRVGGPDPHTENRSALKISAIAGDERILQTL